MNITVQSKTARVTEAMRGFVYVQAEKMMKLAQPVTRMRVFVESVKNWQGTNRESMVKIQVDLPGKVLLVRAKAQNMYAAIATAMEDAKRAVQKQKEVRLAKKRHNMKLAFK